MGGEGAVLHFVEAVPAGMLGSRLTVELVGAARVVVDSAVELEAVAELIVRVAAIRVSFSGSLKVFLAVEPCDLRKSFNGLHALVRGSLGEDPQQGALFMFCNRRCTRLKVLYWDGTGLWVLIKRLVAAPGLLAHILVGKYQDHLLLYRREGIYWSRHGVSLPRQSMAR
jgi:transposase